MMSWIRLLILLSLIAHGPTSWAQYAGRANEPGPTLMAKDDTGTPSKDDLFTLDEDEGIAKDAQPKPKAREQAPAADKHSSIKWSGFAQEEIAYTFDQPKHWSKILTRAQLVGQGQATPELKWKLSARVDYDAVFSATDHFPKAVEDDREFNFLLRENYIDWSVGELDLRLGRQHIVWGEMVGLFFADVVSAKDLREFILPDFDILRIPQWAARAEYFKNDWHAEVIWIPYVSLDEVGALGDDFFPTLIRAPGLGLQVRDRVDPTRNLANTNIGLRANVLAQGWDLAAFFYHGIDSNPHFTRAIANLPTPTVVYTPRHGKIWQAGSTLAKDFGTMVLKAEAIYTHGKQFSVTDFTDSDGVVKQNILDYVVGLDFGLREQDINFNLQFFQRYALDHVDTTIPDKEESGASFLVRATFGDFQPQLLIIQSLNRNDGMIRPRLDWNFARNLRLRAGLDIFHGPDSGLFGQFDNRDRVFVEARYSF